MRINSEIGSEFWLDDEPLRPWPVRGFNYVLSGRTAIDLILQDILVKRAIRTAYLPAYCCDSMVEPFLRRGIEVTLYDMDYDGQLRYYLDESKRPDILYVCNYFGYNTTLANDVVSHFRANGSIVVFDGTHSLMRKNVDMPCDYSFASIRKWMGVVCGAVVNGIKSVELKPYPHLDCKISAMRKKAAFISGECSIDKKEFLNEYTEFGHYLTEDYSDYAMDDLSYAIFYNTDCDVVARRRRENARCLHENLRLGFVGELVEDVVPLFAPVFFDSREDRDRVRKHLIEKQIYCPVHWPKNQLVTAGMKVNNIIDKELSLVCDQRYGVEDMQRIVSAIVEIK